MKVILESLLSVYIEMKSYAKACSIIKTNFKTYIAHILKRLELQLRRNKEAYHQVRDQNQQPDSPIDWFLNQAIIFQKIEEYQIAIDIFRDLFENEKNETALKHLKNLAKKLVKLYEENNKEVNQKQLKDLASIFEG